MSTNLLRGTQRHRRQGGAENTVDVPTEHGLAFFASGSARPASRGLATLLPHDAIVVVNLSLGNDWRCKGISGERGVVEEQRIGAGCARGGGLSSSWHFGRNAACVLRSWSGVSLRCVLLVLLVQCKSQAEVHRSKLRVPNNLVFSKALLISRGCNGTNSFSNSTSKILSVK